MKKILSARLIAAIVLLALFAAFTVVVKTVDVAAIGPQDSEVGLSKINQWGLDHLGGSDLCYDISELFGLVSFLSLPFFAALGLWQAIKRKSLFKIDLCIWLFAGLCVLVMGCYVLFEICIINYRPILVEGVLEASYPSSHTMFSCTLLGSTILALSSLLKNKTAKLLIAIGLSCIIATTVICRLLSGVHWITDILAGILLSAVLVALYALMLELTRKKKKE